MNQFPQPYDNDPSSACERELLRWQLVAPGTSLAETMYQAGYAAGRAAIPVVARTEVTSPRHFALGIVCGVTLSLVAWVLPWLAATAPSMLVANRTAPPKASQVARPRPVVARDPNGSESRDELAATSVPVLTWIWPSLPFPFETPDRPSLQVVDGVARRDLSWSLSVDRPLPRTDRSNSEAANRSSPPTWFRSRLQWEQSPL